MAKLTWRERFLIACGPGVLAGITVSDWLRLLRDNRFAVDLPYWPRAAAVSLSAVINSLFRWQEELRYRRKWESVSVPPPLFVLGHWRSGTTHLHYLLGLDDRFACPNLYQVHFPHTFLSTEKNLSALVGFLLPRHRPYDNVRLALEVPDEDEFALCTWGLMTPYLAGVFSRRAEAYDQFLTMQDVSPAAVEAWKLALWSYVQKLTFKHSKPLILKSPPHTGRIKHLLHLFPDARFIHIHRDPTAVFQSYVHTHETGLPFGRLQRSDRLDWTERLIRQYKQLHEAYFEQRVLIPAGRFHEMTYEQLEHDPLGELQKLYESLSLPAFSHVEPTLRVYLDSQAGYRKNAFGELDRDVKERIKSEWRQCYEEWGYSS